MVDLTWPAQFGVISRLAAVAGQASGRLQVRVTLAGPEVRLWALARDPDDPVARAELDQLVSSLSSLPQWSTSR
jgi:hypothetical protein